MPNHLNQSSVTCDACSTYGVRRTRLICLDCFNSIKESGQRSDTLDLCVNCKGKEFISDFFQQKHEPSHTLLQVRRQAIGDYAATYWASWALQFTLSPRNTDSNETTDPESKEEGGSDNSSSMALKLP